MTRRLVTLDPNLVRVSREYGVAMAKWYATPEGAASPSRSRSGSWGAETDPIRLGQAKAGEYAVASFFGLDLKSAVSRNYGRADSGWDVRIADGKALDVKTTPQRKKWMVWSLELNDLYWKKSFDALVSVSIDEGDWSRCWIEGWLSKQEFFDLKKIADGINDEGKLTPGTWFVEKTEMRDIRTLLAGFVGYNADGNFIHYCHCGKDAGHGYGVRLLKEQLGTWFCDSHNPKEQSA